MQLIKDTQDFAPDLIAAINSIKANRFSNTYASRNWCYVNHLNSWTLSFIVEYELVTIHYIPSISSFEVVDFNHFSDLLRFVQQELGLKHPLLDKMLT